MDFQTALMNFVNQVQSMLDTEDYRDGCKVVIEQGRRYTKLMKRRSDGRGGGNHVYCFIDGNGDILKAASCKAPAKHARGSIYDADPLAAVTTYGAKYLR